MVALCLLSPAKRLEYKRALPEVFTANFSCSRPRFASEALRIARAMRAYDVGSLRELMGVSEQIAVRSQAQFQTFDERSFNDTDLPQRRAAMYAFHGDTYVGLNAYALDENAIARAQKVVRILSGLYGLLCPLDEIQPYRLEMGLAMGKGNSKVSSKVGVKAAGQVFATARTPAAWWRDAVTDALISDIRATNASFVVELASREYMAAIDRVRLPVPLLEVSFATKKIIAKKNSKNNFESDAGVERRLGMAEKRMRGMLAKFIVEKEVRRADELKDFNDMGFSFSRSSSSEHSFRFVKSV